MHLVGRAAECGLGQRSEAEVRRLWRGLDLHAGWQGPAPGGRTQRRGPS